MTKLKVIFFCSLIFSARLFGQINFTITNSSGSNTVTCLLPSLSLGATTDYTAASVTYSWSGPFGTWVNNTYTATIPGIYTITALSGSISSSQTLAVYANTLAPQFVITPTTQNISCLASSVSQVSISITSPSYGVSQKIQTPYGGFYVPNVANHTYLPSAPGTYSFIATDQQNGCLSSKNFQVSSNSGFPTFSLSSPQNFKIGCLTQSMALTQIGNAQTTPTGGATSYTVLTTSSGSIPASGPLSSQTQYGYSVAQNYTVVVRDNATSCEARIPLSIITNTNGPVVSLAPQLPVLSCFSPSLQLVANSSEQNSTFVWTNPSLTVSSGSMLTVLANFSQAPTNTLLGNYTVMVTDNVSLCKTQSVISVYQNIYKPNVAITFGFDDTLTCASQTITIVNSSASGIPPLSLFPSTLGVNTIAWYGPVPQLSLTNAISYPLYTPGIYTLQAMDANNGCVGSGTISVADARDFPVVQSLPLICLPGGGSVLIWPNVTSSDTILAFNWTAPPNSTLVAAGSASQVVASTGVYTLEVFNGGGCSTAQTYTVSDCLALASGKLQEALKIWPNPFTQSFKITTTDAAEAEYELFDTMGKRLLYGKTLSSVEVNTNDLPPGIYYLRLSEADQIKRSMPVIKE